MIYNVAFLDVSSAVSLSSSGGFLATITAAIIKSLLEGIFFEILEAII